MGEFQRIPMDIFPKKIFVRCPNWVGDVVMATPLFECLRAKFADSEICAGIRGYAKGVLEGSPCFDRIIVCDDRNLSGFFETVKKIKAGSFDMSLMLTNSTRTFLSLYLGRAGKIYGYRRNIHSFLLAGGPKPQRLPDGRIKPIPMMDYYLGFCGPLGIQLPEKAVPRLYVSEEAERKGSALLAKYGVAGGDLVIGLNPGAKFGSSKCWPTGHFAKLAEMLAEKFAAKIVLFAGPGEDAIADAIVKQAKTEIINTAPDKVDLAVLKPLVKRCALLVTNDTGPRHYAVAFGVPAVVIMGPTDPAYTSSCLDKTTVLRIPMECSPCHKRSCPLGHHRCMRDISPEMVLTACAKLLEGNKGASGKC